DTRGTSRDELVARRQHTYETQPVGVRERDGVLCPLGERRQRPVALQDLGLAADYDGVAIGVVIRGQDGQSREPAAGPVVRRGVELRAVEMEAEVVPTRGAKGVGFDTLHDL